ncbi:hypothetical protein Scep_002635 [Stephania cephalantha]|uniref:Uncharacterized protein n=1 Tax=Stephania cephalantha TaxID=152367 RepID=A0AAP0LEC1_9MAGN
MAESGEVEVPGNATDQNGGHGRSRQQNGSNLPKRKAKCVSRGARRPQMAERRTGRWRGSLARRRLPDPQDRRDLARLDGGSRATRRPWTAIPMCRVARPSWKRTPARSRKGRRRGETISAAPSLKSCRHHCRWSAIAAYHRRRQLPASRAAPAAALADAVFDSIARRATTVAAVRRRFPFSRSATVASPSLDLALPVTPDPQARASVSSRVVVAACTGRRRRTPRRRCRFRAAAADFIALPRSDSTRRYPPPVAFRDLPRHWSGLIYYRRLLARLLLQIIARFALS